jgi:hypothetical protein
MLRANEASMTDIEDCQNFLTGIEIIDIGPVPIQERITKARTCADRYTVRAQAIVDAKNAAKDAKQQ